MNILLWHVHGSWTDAFVSGRHHYLFPVTPEGGAWGLGRAGRDWPEHAEDVPADRLRERDVDVVVLQRPEEIEEVTRLLGRAPGRALPAIYVEHNTPRTQVPDSVHPLADRTDIPIVHVTHFNDLFWDSGRARTVVIEHGIVDPGPLYTGVERAFAVVINEPVRRWRVTGTDLLESFADLARVDVFGMGGSALAARFPSTGSADVLTQSAGVMTRPGSRGQIVPCGDLLTRRLHAEVAARRVYLHPNRWTSLGLSLLEAMHLAMPVVAVAATEVVRAVPPEAGEVSTDVRQLRRTAQRLLDDPDEARRRGAVARQAVLERHGLQRFLDRWDKVLADEVAAFDRRSAGHQTNQPAVRTPATSGDLEGSRP